MFPLIQRLRIPWQFLWVIHLWMEFNIKLYKFYLLHLSILWHCVRLDKTPTKSFAMIQNAYPIMWLHVAKVNFPELNSQNMQWKHKSSPRLRKAKTGKWAGTVMQLTLFDKCGVIYLYRLYLEDIQQLRSYNLMYLLRGLLRQNWRNAKNAGVIVSSV